MSEEQLAQRVAQRFLKELYQEIIPDGSIDFSTFMVKLNAQVQTDAESREMVSKGITDAYFAELAKVTKDPNAVFGPMFDHLPNYFKKPTDVSKSIVGGVGGGICSMPRPTLVNQHLRQPPTDKQKP